MSSKALAIIVILALAGFVVLALLTRPTIPSATREQNRGELADPLALPLMEHMREVETLDAGPGPCDQRLRVIERQRRDVRLAQ